MPDPLSCNQRGIPVKQLGGISTEVDRNDSLGPKRVLKHGMTLSHFSTGRNLNKVAPENVVPPAPLTRPQKVLAFVENKYVSSFMTACTIFALFGDDLRISLFPKNADDHVYNVLFALFLFFFIELGLNVYSRPNYFNRGQGFSFYMDLISTLSVIPDVDWIWTKVVGSSTSTSASQAAALKAGRASRAGTKAGRIVRLVRLFRMLRIMRVVRKNKNGETKKVEISEPSKIGKVLTEKTTRRLIVLVLLIIIVSPIIDGTVDLTQDDFQTSQFERLHRYTQDYKKSGSVTLAHIQSLVDEYVRDANGLIVQMELASIDSEQLKSWLQSVRFQPLNSDGSDWLFGSNQTLTTNPKTGWSASYLLDVPSVKYRNTEITTVENLGCYVGDVCIDCDSLRSISSCHSAVTFDISSFTTNAANLNIGKTIIVMICFAVSIFVLTRDAETMVIGPIERMMRLVTQLAQNPLGSTEAKREEYETDELNGTDYETKMLEDTLSKIGRLLQVGFGAAGTEIIAKNMGGAGDFDVMIPGKKITSVFGFGIIEHFTETCSILEEDVITYINTIAEIVHGDAKIFHGAANKNIGSAFLLAWKICDGALPGMRDPRDSAEKPRMLPAEKARRREGINIKSLGSGSIMRRIGPTELVDSALTAILKMRVDIHNANHHGTLHKYCMNTKLLAAFDSFEVHLGFGLHIGWAIEGAIGSRFKIDASYLSPNVNMAARLEAATGQFDVPMLISEWFVDELSAEARRFCRKIDRVAVKGSEIPMDLWTFDIGRYPSEGVQPDVSEEGRQKPVEYGVDTIYPALQEGIPSMFFSNFHEGIDAYFAGKWDIARVKLNAANQLWEDGPTKVVLKVIETEGWKEDGEFLAPLWWKGYRQLTEK
ncbi:voltage-gated ion channel superfamily [Plasmopara halstedii]|uniref:Voltage-gated ion channel superfamily n=1 Tax=Plasmopara halstedii TaxID=4781 RepID=A0A0P1A9I5_PLAHL|nr:voltage-gated ion channel superfamily [Plasmopara halstedii]CEG37239.1 voltage-gated ion channel superfamily [Plasmopara halstedii]|eukprot:XP_024573608.1 voltage-gated ion channel superfamily [Plasmopara halstedii]